MGLNFNVLILNLIKTPDGSGIKFHFVALAEEPCSKRLHYESRDCHLACTVSICNKYVITHMGDV